MASAPGSRIFLTLDEFLELPEIDDRPYLEYIDGRIVPKVSPKRKHSSVQLEFGFALNEAAAPGGLGQTFTELRCTFGGRSIIPDVVFQAEHHIEVDDRGEMTEDVTIPPDIHIEIDSPRQAERDAHDKLTHSAAHGCAIGWLVHPYRRAVIEYRPGQVPRRLGDDEDLDGVPVLPGFRLPVSTIWGWLKPRRPRGGQGGQG